jgi:hypothetical protein
MAAAAVGAEAIPGLLIRPARAGLLSPVLQLIRPQLERRLSRVCLELAAGGQKELEQILSEPCRRLARPVSVCLIEETERSGRSFGVLTELLGGRFGDDTEVVAKRCVAKLLGLPVDTLKDVPLRDLNRRFSQRSGEPDTTPPLDGPGGQER